MLKDAIDAMLFRPNTSNVRISAEMSLTVFHPTVKVFGKIEIPDAMYVEVEKTNKKLDY